MLEWKDKGLLGDNPGDALDELKAVLDEHVLPFLSEWWDPANPSPTEDEIKTLVAAIEARAGGATLSAAYRELPALLKELARGMRFNRRNFVNIHPSPFVPSALASFIISLQNPNNIVQEVSEATTKMERESVLWMAEHLFGIAEPEKEGAWGNVVSGGTVANMTALLVARDYTYDKLSRPRPGRVGPRGVVGLKPGVVLGTAGSHYSLQKALWFLGLGHENLVRVPVCWDEAIRLGSYKEERFLEGIRREPWRRRLLDAIKEDEEMGSEELERFYAGEQSPFSLQPLNSEILKTMYACFEFDVPLIACVLTLGTTDTGTIERVDSFALEELRREDIFIHVDAASGGFAFTDEQVRARIGNIDNVDSFTIDPHKLGFLHYPCGAVVFKHKGFRDQIYHEAPYLGPLAPTLEGSRPGGGSGALWLAQRTLGPGGYKAAIGHLLDFTGRLAGALARSGDYQVLHRVDLNAVAVAPQPKGGETRRDVNELVRAVRARFLGPEAEFLINIDRHLSGVKVKNNPAAKGGEADILDIEALRIVVTNPLVDLGDAQRLADILVSYLSEERARRAGGARAFNAAPAAEGEPGRGGHAEPYSEEPR